MVSGIGGLLGVLLGVGGAEILSRTQGWAVTVTPGSTAPVLSVTTPVMRPRISWAAVVPDARVKTTRNPRAAKLRARTTA